MRIPELDLECDVLECVRVVDRELEIVSQTFLEEIEKKIYMECSRVHVVLPDHAASGAIVAYYDAFEEDEFQCFTAKFTDSEIEQLCQLEP